MTAAGSSKGSTGGTGGTFYYDPSGSSGSVQVLGGGTDINPITNLAHEIFHGYEANSGMLNNDDVIGTGLGRNEYRATYFENQIRGGLSSQLRSEYWFRNASNGQGTAPVLDPSSKPIYVPPTPIPKSLSHLGINLIY